MTSLFSFLTEKPAIAPPVFVFQKDKAQKVRFKFYFILSSSVLLVLHIFVDDKL